MAKKTTAKPAKRATASRLASPGRAERLLVRDIDLGLSENARATIVQRLNQILADEFLLYARARAYHWNVTGRNFRSDHLLFEEEYEFLDEVIDDVAERARALGGTTESTMADYLKNARLQETDPRKLDADAMIGDMRDGHEAQIRMLRTDIDQVSELGDEGTTDFLTGLMESHEKRAWMLRSHLSER